MTDLVLRPYQEQSVQALRDGIRAGHRCQILCAPTGSGKTIVGAHLLAEVQRKGTKAAFVVDRVSLCSQTSAVLWKYGIQHGIAQGQNTFGRNEPIQVCSAQTIEKRGFMPDLDLVIVDECHTMRKFMVDFIAGIGKPVIGLTATPFTKGLGQVYSNIVNVTTTNDLIEQGFLAPLAVYAAKEIDMRGAKVVAGEWADREVETRGKAIIGDIVSEWVSKTAHHFGGPVKTICFSATVDHGEEICRQFQAAGYNFQQISYKDGNDERRAELIEEFRKPDSAIVGLVSCEALAKGFDVPDIRAGICARPYRKSLAAHIQMIGRAMRSHPGKEFALWLDHAGNYLGFLDQVEDVFANGVHELDDGERGNTVRKEGEKEVSDLVCSCGYIMKPSMSHCPACGKERVRKSRVEQRAGELVELGKLKRPPVKPYLEDRREAWRGMCCDAMRRKRGDADQARKFAARQFHNFYDVWPTFPFDPGEVCNPELASHIQANVIRFAKGRAKKERKRA